ncbi:MAG: hypothetical protein H0T50_14400 [Gemmatimonadales bacterium]|nr:hypothetical protein [Gemmatimonadales bacterium]
MRPPLDLERLRRPGKRSWAAVGVSVAAHVALLVFGSIEGRLPEIPRRPSLIVVLAPPAEGPREVPMPYRPGRRADGQAGRGVVPTPAPPRPEPETPVVIRPPEPVAEPVDTGVAPRRHAVIGRIRPDLAEGRLWVRPLPLPPQELAERLSRKTHAELVDSAVTAIVQGYLDSIAADPGARPAGLPSWTTEVAGKKFGLDSSNIYIAGLKIPAAVLALLPIPAGNIDQNRAYNHLMSMRADLQYAAQRSQNLQEFKDMIRDMRLRKEREEEFERNQRTAPPPEELPTP